MVVLPGEPLHRSPENLDGLRSVTQHLRGDDVRILNVCLTVSSDIPITRIVYSPLTATLAASFLLPNVSRARPKRLR